VGRWPTSAEELIHEQATLAAATPPPWRLPLGAAVGGCFLCFERGLRGPGRPGDRAWAAAALGDVTAVVAGVARAAYEPGLLALRGGCLLERAVRALPRRPDVLLVNATGRDHPRRAGLALQLGAVLDLPTVGVTHRAFLAAGERPEDEPAGRRPLVLAGEVVGHWLRTSRGARPLAIHAAWRTDPDTAVDVLLACTAGVRTPEPLRRARTTARAARATRRPRAGPKPP